METLTTREAALMAENARLRRLLADAGLQAEEAAEHAAAAAGAQAASLAESRQQARNARQDTQQVRKAAVQAAAQHRAEMATQRADSARQSGLYAALQTSEGRLRLILESAKDLAMVVTDLNGCVTEWTVGARNVLGWDEAEIVGQDARTTWTPEDQAAGIPEEEMRLARDQGRASDERWHQRRDGTRFWASGELMPMRDDAGQLVGYLKTLRDRTEQYEAVQRLDESEAHWRGLFEQLSEGLIIGEIVRDDTGQAVDWRYLDVNPAWGDLIGLDPDHVVGRTIRDVFPGIGDGRVEEMARVVDTGEVLGFTRQVSSLNRWYEGRAFPLKGDRFATLFLEVTRRVQDERRRDALLTIGDQLRDLTTVEAMTGTAASIVGEVLKVARAGFGRLDDAGEYVVIEPDWTAEGVSSIAGRHRFEDFGNIAQDLLEGEPLIVGDALTDPRTAANQDQWASSNIRSLVNIPIRERGRTVAVFLVHDVVPRNWSPSIVAFLRNVGDRLATGVARLEAEEHQAVLNQELSHRMKNLMAMVQAVATQTLKRVTEKDAVDAFRQRLGTLASAHDVLLQKSWTAAQLGEVITAVLSRSCPMKQIGMDGPDVALGPRATLSVSMLVHELATNAMKYGALFKEVGRVTIRWHIEDLGQLVFSWTETGGPPAIEPKHKGFGFKLLRSGLVGTGKVELRYLSTGLHVEMRVSMESLQAA